MKRSLVITACIAISIFGISGCASQSARELSDVEASWENQLVQTINEGHAYIQAAWNRSVSLGATPISQERDNDLS